MKGVFLSIGSNKGDRLLNINTAIQLINRKVGKVVICSPIYENPPLGFEAELNFYNVCLEVETDSSPFELLKKTQDIEFEVGRTSKSKFGNYSSRIIDIDIVLYNDYQILSELLTIPHLLFRERRFVLQPLCDLAPNFIDPITKKAIFDILEVCKDGSVLKIVM